MSTFLWYEIKNFGSFGSKGGVVDLTTSTKDKSEDLWRENSGHRINLLTAVMGANASGKTTLIKVIPYISFLLWRIPEKRTDKLILLNNKFSNELTYISVCFLLDGKEYLYKITLCQFMIFEEELFVKNSRNQNVYLFKRCIEKDSAFKIFNYYNNFDAAREIEEENMLRSVKYSYSFKEQYFKFNAEYASRVATNCLILSEARRLNDALASNIANSFLCSSNVNYAGRIAPGYTDLNEVVTQLAKNPIHFKKVKDIIMKWDLGLKDIKLTEVQWVGENGDAQVKYNIYGVHTNSDGIEIDLPFVSESAGTINALIRLNDIMCCIANGRPCIVDELGDDLHPHMIKPILELFIDPEINKLNSQLLFTCHRPELINYLGKYRVIICEKRENVSECYRLDEFSSEDERDSDNLAAKYLSGAFGGVPEL